MGSGKTGNTNIKINFDKRRFPSQKSPMVVLVYCNIFCIFCDIKDFTIAYAVGFLSIPKVVEA